MGQVEIKALSLLYRWGIYFIVELFLFVVNADL